MATRSSGPAAACAGFTLVEVLAALTILTVGLIGLASLTLAALQGSRAALQHTAATALVVDLAEHIRANRAAAPAYALAAGALLERPALACDTPGECAAADLAALDLYRWQQEVSAALPEPTGSVVVTPADAPGTHLFEICLRWRQSGDAAPASLTLTVQS